MSEWTNQTAIDRWGTMPRDLLAAMPEDGDFCRRHLLNPALLQMVGQARGRRVLDAGCGDGYLARMLAKAGAAVTGIEPAAPMFDFAVDSERTEPLGIRYLQADLCKMPDGADLAHFDAVVVNMVLQAIPDWASALAACVAALRPGGRLVFSVNHPCFEQLAGTWRRHGAYQLTEYLAEYSIELRYGPNFHRPLSMYLNEVIGLGLRITEVAEPGLDAAAAACDPDQFDGEHPYVHLPNFLVVAADKS